jgi:Calcineurin-like phosphoesterase
MATMALFHHRIRYLVSTLFFIAGLISATAFGSQLPPYLGQVTTHSASVNIIPSAPGEAYKLEYGAESETAAGGWHQTLTVKSEQRSPVNIHLKDLQPDTVYRYRLLFRSDKQSTFSRLGSYQFRSQRVNTGPFSFALLSDAHITAQRDERLQILTEISAAIDKRNPEFVAMLGDNIQTFTSHGGPMEDKAYGPYLYRRYRYGLGDLPANVPSFFVMGNWEGENGWHPKEMRTWARQARMAYIPNPLPDTYPQGGGDNGDYYAFSWGDLLCIVLNVTGYTETNHAIGSKVGAHDDWTLGTGQKSWLLNTLKVAKERLKVIFIHHTVGGGSPDDLNARYGRGGGRAALVGEQAVLHQWMRDYKVQALFYGHDHVMTDMPVDGIHYVCVGSAGAPWKFTTQETGYRKYWTDYGYTWVDVDETGMAVSFVAADSTVLHQYLIPAQSQKQETLEQQ